MKNIYAIASISSFSMEVSDYPFDINQNGNNKFKEQLLKLFQDPRSFDKCNFIIDAMYVEGIKQGSVVICDDGSYCMAGKIFSGSDKYSPSALLMLMGILKPVIQCKITQIKVSLMLHGFLGPFTELINEIENQLEGTSSISMEDFIADFRTGLRSISEGFGNEKGSNIEAFLEALTDENVKGYPKELLLMFMVFILLMIIMLIEARMKINDRIT